jgi:hypothetical protein
VNEQSDGGSDLGAGTGGELRRDRRRLREAARLEAERLEAERLQAERSGTAAPGSAATAPDAPGLDTGGLSAFESLGFEPRSFEPSEPEVQHVDDARFRSASSDLPHPGVRDSDTVSAPTPTAEPAPADTPTETPPPLAEPPRREVPLVTHAFNTADLFVPTTEPQVDADVPGETTVLPESPPTAMPPSPAFAYTPAPEPFVAEPLTAGTSAPVSATQPTGHEHEEGHPTLGVLRPSAFEPPRELAVLDWAALILAFVLPPVGFVVGLVAAARGRAYRGWSSAKARSAVWIAVIMTFVFVIVGAVLWVEHQENLEAQRIADEAAAARAGIVAESVEFCTALAANPTLFDADDPDYGWPQIEDPAGYVPAIMNYAAIWQGLVPLAPSGIAEPVQTFSARVDGMVAFASSLPTPNRPGDILDLRSQPDITAIDEYVTEYCGEAVAQVNTGE